MHIHTNWDDIAQSLACGLVSSFIFLFVTLFLLRPSIKISPYISKIQDEMGNTKYVFKILNRSLFSAFDVRCELVALERYAVEGENMNVKMTKVPLINRGIDHMPRFRRRKGMKPYALHAMRFSTYNAGVDLVLNNTAKSLLFSLTARHGLSGLSKHFTQDFADISVLKAGRFKFGNSLDVV